MRTVIIGNGVAGIEAALVVREREPDWDITIISEESDHFFSRTALMWVVTGQLSHRCIEPHERDLYQRLGITRVRARATGLDRQGKKVLLAGGHDAVHYDRLLIACGSKPRPAPWPGADLPGIGHFVTLQDCEWLEDELHGGPSHAGGPPRSSAHHAASDESSPYWPGSSARALRGGAPEAAAVIGGGLIGIEAVEVLRAAGVPTRFYIREDWFWPLALEERESTWIADRMREHGVDVRLGEEVQSFGGEDRVRSVETTAGVEEADLAVIAIGVVPNTEWLEQSGLELQERGRGLIVDEHLRTSDPDILAAGDCAAVRWFDGSRRPQQLWYTARDQGRVAGRALVGDSVAKYDRGHWYNSAKLMDIEYTTAGLVNMNVEGERNFFHEEHGRVRSTTRIVLSGDRVVGFNLLGRRWDQSVLLRFIQEHRSLEYVLRHMNEAAFDTEFVPPLELPRSTDALEGAAPSKFDTPVTPRAV